MAGYSGTPLQKKLGLREGQRLALIGAPPGFASELGELPSGARIPRGASAELDLALLFVLRRAALARDFAPLAKRLAPAGMLWVAWPKKASKVQTDLVENAVREIGLDAGLVDVKVCAVNDIWSGLKFVRRLKDR